MNQNKSKSSFKQTLVRVTALLIVFMLSAVLVHGQSTIDRIEQLSFSPDGQYIAVAGGSSGCDPEEKATEYAVRIVDALTGQIVNRFVGHNCRLVAIDWSPDGTRIVSSSFDGLSLIWDVQTGSFVQYLRVRPEIGLAVVWSPDSTMIASIGSGGNYAMVWSAATGEILFNLPSEHTAPTTSVVWNPDGTQIATSALDNTIRVWDVSSQQSLLTIQSSNQIYWVDWSPDGAQLVSANRDGLIEIWDAASGEAINSFSAGTSAINIVLWNPDNRRLATANTNNTVQIWDSLTGEELAVFQYDGELDTIVWNPAGDYLAFSGTRNDEQNAIIEIEFVALSDVYP